MTGAGWRSESDEPRHPVDETVDWAVRHVNDIDDRLARRVGILAFGLSIPHLAGLFGPLGPRDPVAWVGIGGFVLLSAAIWHGNRWLLFRQRERLDWFTRPVGKVLAMVVGCVFYTAPVTAGSLLLWYAFAGIPVDGDAIRSVVLLNVICVLFVAHVYETVFLVKAREDDRVAIAELERARIEGELAALRRQIDPHFLFNALNTLGWLIPRDADAAVGYSRDLAEVYRYILANRERELVLLRDELGFVDACFQLLSRRFGDAIRLELDGVEEAADRWLIPPISLQVLFENAVKHNAFTAREPLAIRLSLQADLAVVENASRPQAAPSAGAGTGLANLGERCRRIMGRDLSIQPGGVYRVEVPMVRVSA